MAQRRCRRATAKQAIIIHLQDICHSQHNLHPQIVLFGLNNRQLLNMKTVISVLYSHSFALCFPFPLFFFSPLLSSLILSFPSLHSSALPPFSFPFLMSSCFLSLPSHLFPFIFFLFLFFSLLCFLFCSFRTPFFMFLITFPFSLSVLFFSLLSCSISFCPFPSFYLSSFFSLSLPNLIYVPSNLSSSHLTFFLFPLLCSHLPYPAEIQLYWQSSREPIPGD